MTQFSNCVKSSRTKAAVLVVVVAKWLELWPHKFEVPSSNPPGAKAFFSSSSINGRVSLIRFLKRVASLLFFLFPMTPLAVLSEAKQA